MIIIKSVINYVINAIEHIGILDINVITIGIIIMLNCLFFIICFDKLKDNKYLPWAIHITDVAYRKNRLNKNIYQKLSKVHVNDNVDSVVLKYYYKKISLIMSLVLIINIFSMIVVRETNISSNLIHNQYILLPKYGQDSKKVNLSIEYSNKKKGKKDRTNLDVVVKPNRLSKKQEAKLIMKVKEYIWEHALGDNRIYGEIKSKLNLMTNYHKDANINISWVIDEQGLIKSSGEIDYNNIDDSSLREGIDIELVAKINYFDNVYTYPLAMTVYGPNEKTGDSVVSRIKEEISNLNSKYSYKNMIKLPSKIGNNSVTYSEPKNNSKINNWIMVMIIGLVVILAISIGTRKDMDKEIEEKNRVLLMNYSELICKFRLLLCAGLNITAVWEKICEEYLHNKEMTGEINYTYEEMLFTYNRIKMGIPQVQAYKEFGTRIGLSPYIKLSTLILQNIKTGAEGFIEALELESKSVESMQKELYVKEGEKLGTKLLIPMIVMMGITMVIVVIPAFISM